MPQPATDRQLLLGILALQNSFIDRNTLIAAFDVWVQDKTRSLGDILLERRALDADTLALLNGLVAKHLKMHCGVFWLQHEWLIKVLPHEVILLSHPWPLSPSATMTVLYTDHCIATVHASR